MSSSASNYQLLINKLDEFVRKYYLNQVVKGILYLLASALAIFILLALAEYYGNFSSPIRRCIFYSYVLLNSFIFIKWIIVPILSLFKLGKTISHEQAAAIIGEHFEPIKDKLLNTLQLKKLVDENPTQKTLIEAGINQKISELKLIPFSSAIDLKQNRKYLKYVLPPVVILILIFFTAPAIISESTVRLIKYDKKFVKKAPFTILITNRNLNAIQGEDFTLNVKIIGKEIPQDVYVIEGNNTYKLQKENILKFNYTFRNIQESKKIQLSADGYFTEPRVINVQNKPVLLHIDAYLNYPTYLKKKNEKISNTGDFSVPEGTKITLSLNAENTDLIKIIPEKSQEIKIEKTNNNFAYTFRALANNRFAIKALNKNITPTEETILQVNTIQDQYPIIEINSKADSGLINSVVTFGQIRDDYGFNSLKFIYTVYKGNKALRKGSKTLIFDKTAIQSNFLHEFSIQELQLNAGEYLSYYYVVSDNDGVHGPKSTKSVVKSLKVPSFEESEKKIELSAKNIEKKMEQALKQAAQIDRDAKKLTQELINKNTLSFEDKKQIEQLLDKKKDLENLLEQLKQENSRNLSERQDLKAENEKILEKQKQIENLFNNVLDEKTKELLKNIQKLVDENNKSKAQQELSKAQMDNKMLQKELDRILELYKQLQFDQKLNDLTDKLNQLSEQQKNLKDKTLAQKSPNTQLKEQQNQLNKKFEDLQKEINELDQLNKELNTKNNFENPQQETKDIQKELQTTEQELNKGNHKKASENQQNAAQQMKMLSQKLSQMQEAEEMEENSLNLKTIREILKNLLAASFDQERTMQALKSSTLNDPGYKKLTQKQKEIKDNLSGIQDSLFALSKKAPQIASSVNKEIQEINQNIDKAISLLADRRTAEANRNQQFAMTSINNLALMLSEVESAMQKMMQNAQSGGKGKKKSLSQLRQMQEQLNQNMEKARQQMKEKGVQPGQSYQGKGQLSEQLAKMAREQQLIRQSLQEINRELNKDGKGGLGNLEKLSKEMEQTETDFVNKKIEQQTLYRQQEILTKLLEAEKAERERDIDNKRESKQGKEQSANLRLKLKEFEKIKQKEVELLKTVSPDLNSFYRNKVGDYFRLLNSDQ